MTLRIHLLVVARFKVRLLRELRSSKLDIDDDHWKKSVAVVGAHPPVERNVGELGRNEDLQLLAERAFSFMICPFLYKLMHALIVV